MKIKYRKMLMQRYRPILHLVDPLLRKGHKIYLVSSGEKYTPAKFYADPWNVNIADVNAMRYLVRNFGLITKGIKKVRWTKDKYESCDLVVGNDTTAVNDGKTPLGSITIPYMGFDCYTPKGRVTVGNQLCQAIRARQAVEPENLGMVLIVHPGGGRDFLSPKRKRYSPEAIIRNNISLMTRTLAALPEVSRVVIKTHPAPYKTCDCKSMISEVLPHLSANCPISVRNDDLIGLICQSEFIINYGSSTVLWLLGSPKKWVNIIDQSKFNLKSNRRRDRVIRAENWWNWPQNIPLSSLRSTMENYDVKVDRSAPFMRKYHDLYELNAITKCVELIEEFGP